ncbi:MAG: acyl-CoA/acyl-ACP dehydrogenase [Burkholderiales bacterium]|nr:acyl-CoA/acyl-ACP dehydrogenase [Burkholderiales bacterium]
MDFALTQEQQMMREAARSMVEREIAPVLAAHAPDRPMPKAAALSIFGALANLGITAPRLPERDGGGGLKMLDYGLMFEQLPPVVSIALLAHECTIARIWAETTPENRERFLPELIAGRRICCTGTTEPDVGSDPRSVKTRVVRDADTLVINGRKMWITNVTICDVINVSCAEGTDERGLSRLRRVVVDRAEAPFETREIPSLGLRQGHLGEAVFNDTRVPARNALGTSGDAARMLTLTWNGNRPLVGLAAVHLAQRALDAAREYAGIRVQFGKPIGGHQLIQKNLADIETAVTTSRLLCYFALDQMDRGERANGTSAMAKRYATSACEQAISVAMQVHGAMGISAELGLEALYRDVRMLPIPDATNEILTLIQGREITGLEAFRA